MRLKDIKDKLNYFAYLQVVINDCGNYAGPYTDTQEVNAYMNCEVLSIEPIEEGVLSVTVDGNTEEES